MIGETPQERETRLKSEWAAGVRDRKLIDTVLAPAAQLTALTFVGWLLYRAWQDWKG